MPEAITNSTSLTPGRINNAGLYKTPAQNAGVFICRDNILFDYCFASIGLLGLKTKLKTVMHNHIAEK
jgi:hypothetical protein